MMRLTSDLWVKALVRRVYGDGGFAAIERGGAKEAGAIFIRTRARDGLETLFAPAPQSLFDTGKPEDRLFEKRLADVAAKDADSLLAREAAFDPDLWVVEIETDQPEIYIEVMPDERES